MRLSPKSKGDKKCKEARECDPTSRDGEGQGQSVCIQTVALSLTSSVTLGKSLNLFMLQ